jgi:hypothetical protein
MRSRMLCVLILVVAAAGCKGSKTTNNDGNPNPAGPSNTPAANRAPTINSATVNPGAGIAGLSSHAFSSSASDPDGDAVTYSWDFDNGTSSTSSGASVTFTNANTVTYRPTLTVRDSRGATASTTLSVSSVTLAGNFSGFLSGIGTLNITTTQFVGGVVTGTWSIPAAGISGDIGPTGEPGKIQSNGQFELRFKVLQGSFNDFYFRGNIDNTGRTLTGNIGVGNLPITMTKQ